MLRQMPVSTSVTRQSGGCSPSSSTFLPASEMTQSEIGLLAPVEEEVLDDVGLVAEAEHEIAVPVLAVVLHHVPQDRLLADRDHRLGDALGVVADAGAEAAAEQNDFHDTLRLGSMTCTSGIGTMNWPPHSPTWRICCDDLVLQVPGQDQDVVGLGLVDGLDRLDRDVRARREAAVLVGVAVDGEVEEVGADAAVVEQRVALARRAVAARSRLPCSLRGDQEREQLALGRVAPARRSARRCSMSSKPLALSRAAQLAHARRDRPCAELGVREIDAQRAAVRRELLDVEERQAVPLGQRARSVTSEK